MRPARAPSFAARAERSRTACTASLANTRSELDPSNTWHYVSYINCFLYVLLLESWTAGGKPRLTAAQQERDLEHHGESAQDIHQAEEGPTFEWPRHHMIPHWRKSNEKPKVPSFVHSCSSSPRQGQVMFKILFLAFLCFLMLNDHSQLH